jgi:hypothetical protein
MFVEVVAYGRYARNGLSYYGSITCGEYSLWSQFNMPL